MKIQHLAIIFVLIILPIDIVLGLYIDAQINTLRNQSLYDSRLLSCVYDALEVYQNNSLVDTENDIVTLKMDNISASASTFLTSLQASFGYSGYKETVMQEYVPAVVYTMYDGYYIYSKFTNTLTNTSIAAGSTYNDGDTVEGIKDYVFYSCRYKYKNGSIDDDFVITYTLDNYITISGLIGGNYQHRSGYLIDGIEVNGSEYKYDGIIYKEDETESLREFVGDTEYPYTRMNGTKYYYDNNGTPATEADDRIFYILHGDKIAQVSKNNDRNGNFEKYKKAIINNKSAYLYYKEAYDFTRWVRNQDSLNALKASDAVDTDGNKLSQFGNDVIFGENESGVDKTKRKNSNEFIQDSDSIFNQHRAAVIRYSLESNLRTAIAGFSRYTDATTGLDKNYSDQLEFAMPKISETDWDIIEKNMCVIGFLQGLDIGTKKYNGYAVAANTTTKEYVSENSIYITTYYQTSYGTRKWQYHRANSTDLYSSDYKNCLNHNYLDYHNNSVGVFKIDFERSYIKDSNQNQIYYYPKSVKNNILYDASYSSVIMQVNVNTNYDDMYKYMREFLGNVHSADNENDIAIKTLYYTALARERYGSYKMEHDLDNNYYLINYLI